MIVATRKVANMIKDKQESSGSAKFWLGAVVGAVAGTIAGIIIAPKSGEETRKDIAEASKKLSKNTRSRFDKIFKRKKAEPQKRLTAGKVLEEPKE